jgi:hypothetical protein
MDTTTFTDYVFESPVGTVKMLKQLASGSYGTVWTAETKEQSYAVKILDKHGLDANQLDIQALEYELHAKVSSRIILTTSRFLHTRTLSLCCMCMRLRSMSFCLWICIVTGICSSMFLLF